MPDLAMHAGAVDHLVLPVGNLLEARQRLSALGFTVAGDARHPFGTENACVFLADDTYLEPLAIGDAAAYAAAIEDGNVFVSRDRRYRLAAPEGLSAIVAKSSDAAQDDARFRAAGLSAGPILAFERPMTLSDGRRSVAGFRLAFAATQTAEPLYVFACERINALPADRGALETHANGVRGLARVVLVAEVPQHLRSLLAALFPGGDIREIDGGLTCATANLRMDVVRPDALTALCGLSLPIGPAGATAGLVVFATADMEVTAKLLAANGLPFSRRLGRLIVPPSAGQGVAFAFEEIS